ncbi:MAG: serine/threonine-protein kinase, partial [Fibrobacteria bacterium]
MQTPGRYTILEEIASGGTATVYLAEDTVLRRKVALKKLHPHLHSHPLTVRRFEKEAVAVASLSHGNIIKVYDYGSEEKTLFLAMEYVDGVSLDGLLQSIPNGMPSLTALSVFHQLLEGLNAAHANGIYHRDIKPSNILVDRKGCVRIADFGIAFLSKETSITKTGSYLGTPGYSAPEQAQGLA